MQIHRQRAIFEYALLRDIGGVTAEEVNAVPLADLLDTENVENFGWGIRAGENFAREGSFKVTRGNRFGQFGVDPSCISEQTLEEEAGFILPYMQFGNPLSAGGAFYGISSATVADASFDEIKVAATVFNENIDGTDAARLIIGVENYDDNSALIQPYIATLYKEVDGDLVELPDGFTNLVEDELGLDGPERGDPRVFELPDGSAGVLIERTGKFYKLEELERNPACREIVPIDDDPEFEIAVKVTEIGSVPMVGNNTDSGKYNLAVVRISPSNSPMFLLSDFLCSYLLPLSRRLWRCSSLLVLVAGRAIRQQCHLHRPEGRQALLLRWRCRHFDLRCER
jgi:hypothetical protein